MVKRVKLTGGQGSGRLVDVTEEDYAYAVSQDRANCAIVRSIQRTIPEALFVTADKETIRFTMPFDRLAGQEGDGVRYTFQTPAEAVEHVIKPLDLKQTDKLQPYSFVLDAAIDARPMKHHHVGSREQAVRRQQNRETRQRSRSKNPNVRTYNRFLDAGAAE